MIKCWLLKFFKVCLLCTFFIKNKQIKLSNANFKFNRRLWHRSQGNLKSKISEHAYTHTYIVCLSSLTQKPFRILENESRTYVRVGKYFLFSSNRELIQKKIGHYTTLQKVALVQKLITKRPKISLCSPNCRG